MFEEIEDIAKTDEQIIRYVNIENEIVDANNEDVRMSTRPIQERYPNPQYYNETW